MFRKFFYICAGMLMLALAFHLGHTTATAQGPGNPVVAAVTPVAIPGAGGATIVITANGDVYGTAANSMNWMYIDNVFAGPPISTQRETWGQLKSRYAPTRGTAKPGAEGR